MTLSTHHAIDVPRGTRIVSPESHGLTALAGRTIDAVRFADGAAELTLDGAVVCVPAWLKLTVDNDAPMRRARLAWADAMVDVAGAEDTAGVYSDADPGL